MAATWEDNETKKWETKLHVYRSLMTIYLLHNVGRLIKHYQPARPSFNDLFVQNSDFETWVSWILQKTPSSNCCHLAFTFQTLFPRKKGKRFLFSTYPETFTSIKIFLLLSQQFFSLHHGHKSKGNNKDGDCVTERSWQRKIFAVIFKSNKQRQKIKKNYLTAV